MLQTSNQPAWLNGATKIWFLRYNYNKAIIITTNYNAIWHLHIRCMSSYCWIIKTLRWHMIHNTSSLKAEPPLQIKEEYVSHYAYSLFINVLVIEKINYILVEIFNHHKLKPIWSKITFKRLSSKINTESNFIFNIKYYKQTDSCTMKWPLSVVLFWYLYDRTWKRRHFTTKETKMT